MIGAFLGGILLLILAVLAGRWFVTVPPGDVARAARVFAAVLGGLAGLGLLAFGRVGLAIMVIAATVTAWRSLSAQRRPATAMGGDGGDGGGDGRTSSVETRLLRMRLDHASGALDGEVREGRFAGRALESMGLAELLELLADARRDDPNAVALLETYLDRRHPDWREGGTGAGGGDSLGGGAMDERHALEILGLSPGATPEEIKLAHRRLMTKLHPDRGGSTFLAGQINSAKDLLLRRRRS